MRIYKVEYKGIGTQKFSVPSESDFAFGVKVTEELPYSAMLKGDVELSALSNPVNGYKVYPCKTGSVGIENYKARLIGLETRPVPTQARLFKSRMSKSNQSYVTYGLPVTDDNFWASSNPPAGLSTVYLGEYVLSSGEKKKMVEATMTLRSNATNYNCYRITFKVEGSSGSPYTELLFLKKALTPADETFIDLVNPPPGAGYKSFPAGYVQSWDDAPNCVGADHGYTFFQRDAYQGIGYIDVPTQVPVVKNEVPVEVRSVANPYMYVDFTNEE